MGGTCFTLARFQAERVLDAIEHHAVSDIVVVPTTLQSLLDAPELRRERVQGLTLVAFSAAPMPPDLLGRALDELPRAQFFQAYGMTETAGAVCMNPPDNHRAAARAQGSCQFRGPRRDGALTGLNNEGDKRCNAGHS